VIGPLLVAIVEAVELGDDKPSRERGEEQQCLCRGVEGALYAGASEESSAKRKARTSPSASATSSARRTSQPRGAQSGGRADSE